MWNKRPEEELTKRFEAAPAPAPATGNTPTAELPTMTEVKNEVALPAMPVVAKTNPAPVCSAAVIGKGVKIVGEIYSSEDLLVEGFVQGSVEALNQRLTVGPNGTMHANVQVRELDVQGTVHGNIDVCERVDIRKDATLIGDIRAARIVLEDGAYFKGKIDIVRPEPVMAQPPTPQPIRIAAKTNAAKTPVREKESDLAMSGTR